MLEGNCDEGLRVIDEALGPHPGQNRFYPVKTGQGDIQASAMRRRMQIEDVPETFRPKSRPAWCRG